MTKAVQRVLESALKLSDEEQDELILQLLGMNEEMMTDEETLTDEWKAELDRRIARMDAHPGEGVSPEEAIRIVEEMLKRNVAK